MSTTRVFVSYEQFVTDEYTYCLHCLLITMYSSTSSVINLMVITCATWQYHTSKMHQLGQYLDGGQGTRPSHYICSKVCPRVSCSKHNTALKVNWTYLPSTRKVMNSFLQFGFITQHTELVHMETATPTIN